MYAWKKGISMHAPKPAKRLLQGFGALPQHCGQLMGGFFAIAILMSLIRDVLPEKWSRFVPIPMAMAIPFYIGANVAIDICIGALVKAYWHWSSPATAEGKVRAHAGTLLHCVCVCSHAVCLVSRSCAAVCLLVRHVCQSVE